MESSTRRLKLRKYDVSVPATASTVAVNQAFEENKRDSGPRIPTSSMAYVSVLLVSPPLPPLSGMAMMFTASFKKQDTDRKFIENPTLVVFGDADGFTSRRKYRGWVEGLAEQDSGNGNNFGFLEVQNAGHFWREAGVQEELKHAVAQWIQGRRSPGTKHLG